jgi:ketosteroid isomerase-like protein
VPTTSRVQEFVDCVLSNEHVNAIESFYHVDATMQENLSPPRGPRAALMEAERRMLAAHKTVVTSLVAPVFVNGDESVIHWIFEFTRPDGTVMRIEELAHQIWRGDRIASERFYYDSAQMRS